MPSRSAIAILLVGLVFIGWLSWPRGDRAPSVSPPPNAEAAPLDPDPVEPTEQAPAPAPQPSEAAPDQAPQAPAAKPAEATPTTIVRPPPGPTGEVELLSRAYENDRADPTAQQDEAKIRALSGTNEVPVGTLRGARCTKRVCRVEVRWTEQQPYGYMAVGMLLFQQFGGLVAMRRTEESKDQKTVDMELFVARAKYTVEELK